MFLNINKNKEKVKEKDIKHTKEVMVNDFLKMIQKNNFNIYELKTSRNPMYVYFKDAENTRYEIYFYLKNVSYTGWYDKPKYKRIQVNNIKKQLPKDFKYNSKIPLIIFFGYYNHDNNPLFVSWFSYNYLDHSTQRSCYVTLDIIEIAYEIGMYEGIVSGQKVWVYKSNKFSEFLESYIKYFEEDLNAKN